MLERDLTLVNKRGLHARAAAALVKVATRFRADVRVRLDGREADGRNIMSVMMLAASCGTTIRIVVEGEDEAAALEELDALVADRFGEEE